ncbi:MAG: hypothetical protein A3E79_11745 [Burkholderiales bacterium RIFCSPHIGHO2_12_FULL_61_11]|nr:MAG: hypothetical protein A3E79_11745 [Burkholderiales bacterium RIFCSPHIGHO2_12_FULL_61_11]
MAKKDAVKVDPESEIPGVVVQMEGEPGERLPMAIPEGGWPADEFTGQAGSFVRDPFTGVRSRAVADGE